MFMNEFFEIFEGVGEFIIEGFALVGKFDQGFHILNGCDQSFLAVQRFLVAGTFLLDRLSLLLVIPEVRFGDFFVEFENFLFQTIGVKDTP